MADAGQTIIIKKINKGGHGHHGGAWKVAYADFVTAMMAFFLLMWLLNATEAESLSGLADYFAPTVGITGNMGIGFRGGKAALSKGIGADKNTNKGIVFGGVQTGPVVKVTERLEMETEEPEQEKILIKIGESGTGKSDPEESDVLDKTQSVSEFSEVAEAVEAYINETAKDLGMEESIDIKETIEGLEIQIKDSGQKPMFQPNKSELMPHIKESLKKLAQVLGHMPNYISITGHTSSVPVKGKKNYSNWELSTDRANAVRRALIAGGIQAEQIAWIVGKSDNEPIDPAHPAAPINNRLSIILLKEAKLPGHKLGAPKSVFIDTASESAKELVEEKDNKEEIEQSSEFMDAKEDVGLKEVIEHTQDQTDAEPIVDEGAGLLTDPGIIENPFEGENAPITSDKLLVEEAAEVKAKKKEGVPPVNAHLFEEDEEDEEFIDEYENLPVQDPISSGVVVDPFAE